MRRFSSFLAVCLLVAGAPASAMTLDELEVKVRAAASVTYVHGMTEEIALAEVGPEGVPVLLDLLVDPDFERRDNVVAFLAYLAGDAHTPALVSYLDHPAAPDARPEDHRARLLIPTALGVMAARGQVNALAALNVLSADAKRTKQRGLEKMVARALTLAVDGPEAFDAPDDARGAAATSPTAFDGPPVAAAELGGDAAIESLDPDPNIDALLLTAGSSHNGVTYANHVDNDFPIDDERVDLIFEKADLAMAQDQSGSAPDTACCVLLSRVAPGITFGSSGDGLDEITTGSELNQAIGLQSARFAVVDVLNYCGGFAVNIVGCGFAPGDGIVVERLSGSSPKLEGLLWTHELGHNTGLNHNPAAGYIMSASLSSNGVRLTSNECSRYHNPLSQAHLSTLAVGECHDDDGDGVVSSVDNCETVENFDQANDDTDALGNACDNCDTVDNPGQEDCDWDMVGDACDAFSGPPTEISPIHFDSKVELGWPVFPPRNERIYRGNWLAPAPFAFNEVAIGETDLTTTTFDDPDQPAVPNQAFFYLVRGFNGCGEGP